MLTFRGCADSCAMTLLSGKPDSVRTFVTGAAGFVAGYLIRELLRAGHSVIGGTLDGRSPDRGVLTREEQASVRWLELDVTSDASTTAAVATVHPELVFHLAAQSSVGASYEAPFATWDVNATGTLRLLQALEQHAPQGARVLVVSSAEVYGTVPDERQPITEGAPLAPTSPYGASKAAGEMLALYASSTGHLDVIIARSFNHTGPGQDERFSLPSFARQLASMRDHDERVLRVGNLQVRRDFLDVRDVIRAYRCLVERGENGTIYNVCSGEATKLRDLVELMVELSRTGARLEVDPARVRPADTPLLFGDPSRLRALGWEPRISLRQTLTDLLHAARTS
jgi:GDP-4-dehydro-6-deoxy-D-mannose reductase